MLSYPMYTYTQTYIRLHIFIITSIHKEYKTEVFLIK